MTLTDRDRDLLLQTFLTEAGEHLRTLEESLVALEARPDDAELLNGIFRVAHSLKGDALMVGFPRIAEFAHGLEDLLERLRDGALAVDADVVSLLLRAVDVLRALLVAAAAGQDTVPADLEATQAAIVAACAGPDAELSAPAEQAATTKVAVTAEGGTLRVDVAKLDRMLNLTGEIAIARGRVAQMMEALPAHVGQEILEAHRDADRLQMELQEQVMKARMVPVGPFFRQYSRTVRDVARAHGKSVRLVIEGDDVELDTRVAERLRDPLTHMIRNSIDHGIESPELRAALGKAPEGCLTLRAAHEGGLIVIEVHDDGAGFNRQRIAERARATGVAVDPQQLPDSELLGLVFAPGFSTAETVTDLSGRGVGMDVVRRNIEGLRGNLSIASVDGEGATITIRLPLTLAIIDGFGIGVGDETYVVPLDAVLECLALPADSHRDGDGHGVINLRGEPLPYLRLRDRFKASGAAPQREHVLVVQHAGGRAGIAVDALYGERQAVIKSLGAGLDGLSGLSGSTILGDGRVALILDVPALLREAVGRSVSSVSTLSE
ncbi:MAG TPA: chemotaxis protein CheA [Gemmatimonadales bacterium]|nr:chemotaxis protein CheA [Gemmatimonadales bacterium]